MPTRRPLFATLALAATLVIASVATAFAQTWPSKPIQLVIPYPPGGSDALARKLIIGMGEKLGQTIVVVNKPGASTQIATAHVVQAAPDGYTLYWASPTDLAAGPSLFKSLPFNALADLTPVSYVADAPYALVVSTPLPVKTVKEFAAVIKAGPDKVKFGSYGTQSQNDITARRYNHITGAQTQIIPYQGGSPSLNAIVRNEVQAIFATLIPTRSFIDSGQMRAIAIASEKRVARYPDVPTLKESGIDLVDAAGFVLMGPKGLPADIVTKMHAVLIAEMAKPEIVKFLDDLGVVPVASTPAELAQRLSTMATHWADFAKTLGLEKQ